jgi:SpoVK/Ycf46/Vps4 family AAA+-type ATPase
MMKNTFYKLQSKNFRSLYKQITYFHKANKENIFKNYNTIYKLDNEDKVYEKITECMQDSKYMDALFYYDANKNKILLRNSQIEGLMKQVKEKYQNQIFDKIDPIFLSNSVILKHKYIFYSKAFNIIIFFFLLYITSDINFSFFKRTYHYFNKARIYLINEANSNPDKDTSPQKEETKSEDADHDDEEDQELPLPFFPKKEKEFKLAKNVPDRLADVKGIDEVKEEIEEIVNMLKNPQKYEEAGAKLIRGVLLVGQPGTGKTLLARALAGESGINFIYLSASEFEQSLVGMGSIKLKKLFRFAKKNSPCIIFIDEIDSLLHKGKRSGYI